MEAAFDDMSFFPFRAWDAEDRVILGCISRLFGLSLFVLGNYSPRRGPWALMESGPRHKFSGPTVAKIVFGLFVNSLRFCKNIAV